MLLVLLVVVLQCWRGGRHLGCCGDGGEQSCVLVLCLQALGVFEPLGQVASIASIAATAVQI